MATKDFNLQFLCPHCNTEVGVHAEIGSDDLVPDVRSKLRPMGTIAVYKISSEDMKAFITAKARAMIPDVKVEVVPVYCERRRRQKDLEPHRSYASLRIAFSDNVLEKKEDDGWYGKIGETSDNLRFVSSLFHNIIQKYRYDRKTIDRWLDSYKSLEQLEDALGMTEKYINELKMFSTPRRIMTVNKEPWVIFAAAAENVIHDMLTEIETNRVIGRIQIQDVYPVSNDVVEFVVYVHPNELHLKENPHVRQILLGEEKAKH